MKKLVAGAAVAALLGSAAFADVNVGLSGKNVAAIGNSAKKSNDGTEVIMTNTTENQSYGTRYGISFDGSTDNFGVHAQLNYNGDSNSNYADMFDGAYVWYSPIEQLKLWFGQSAGGNPLRGNACYGLWDIYRIGVETSVYKESWTFQAQEINGAVIEVHPIEGLSFYASLGYDNSTGIDDSDTTKIDNNSRKKMSNIFGRQSKYAIAYAIGGEDGIATIKVGLDEKGKVAHNKDNETKDQNIINAAVDLKPMENLFISVGAFIPTVQYSCDDDGETTGSCTWDGDFERSAFDRVNAYVRFGAMEGLNIHARIGTVINCFDSKELKKDNKDGKIGFLFGAGVDYALMEDLTLYADVGYANGIFMAGSSADHNDCLDFGIGVTKSYDACSVSAGFVGATNGYGMYNTTYTDNADNGDTKYPFSWGIPLRVSYSF